MHEQDQIMENRQSSQEIDERAAHWAARVDRGQLTQDEEAALEAWLAVDTRNVGAYAKARAVALHTERARALGPAFGRALMMQADPPKLSRRRLLWLASAAALAGAAVMVGITLRSGSEELTTRLGETRVIPLEDGSVVTLNTSSRIIVSYSREARRIDLVEGEALFDVTKDRTRSFIVAVDGTEVRAVGTSFTVQRLQDKPMQVLVREGVVEVKRVDVPVAPIVRVAANTRAIAPVDAAIATHAVSSQAVKRELAWRVGRIAFEGETLAQAAEAFARYSDIRIVIDDAGVANETITGLFVSNDPVGFSKAVALSLNLRADVAAGEVRLSR